MADNSNDMSKSGIQGPAGYNGKVPPNLNTPGTKYPGTANMPKGPSGGGMIEGPAKGANKSGK